YFAADIVNRETGELYAEAGDEVDEDALDDASGSTTAGSGFDDAEADAAGQSDADDADESIAEAASGVGDASSAIGDGSSTLSESLEGAGTADTSGDNAFLDSSDGQSSIDEARSTDLFADDTGVDSSGAEGGFTTIGSIFATLNSTIGQLYEETFIGGEGDDVLEGGLGTDFLYGGEGADTYVYWLGDGADTINDTGSESGAGDTIEIQMSDLVYTGVFDFDTNLSVSVSGDDMTLDFQLGDGISSLIPMGSITIEGMGTDAGAIETLEFVDDGFSYDFDLSAIFDAADAAGGSISFADAAEDSGQLADYHTALDAHAAASADAAVDTDAAAMAGGPTFDGFSTGDDDTTDADTAALTGTNK
ncbi:MAG: hypothetical protein AAF684_06160, partial [Pseudomonadota bacterium]